MKVKPLYLFIFILAVLLLCYILTTLKEGMTSDSNSNTTVGISKSDIPAGNEDLYILKSQIVPPVCPACPTITECPRQKPCPACPPCGRCPEPAFDCKKVPNYSAGQNNTIPRPVLSDFSQFGM